MAGWLQDQIDDRCVDMTGSRWNFGHFRSSRTETKCCWGICVACSVEEGVGDSAGQSGFW